MPTFNSMLVPTDFSENAATALRVASRLARESGASLSVVTVVPRSALRHAIQDGLLTSTDDDDTLSAKVNQDVERRLREFLEQLGPEAEGISTHHVFGDPHREIVTYAASKNIELIVMGRRGRTLADVMLGSVAERVVRHASCPVLIVKTADG